MALGVKVPPNLDDILVAVGSITVLPSRPVSAPLTVAVTADQDCCRTLGATMFSTPEAEVDQGMIEDALCELVNMTAGLLKSAMSIDQALGLPQIHSGELMRQNSDAWIAHYLKAGQLNLVLAVATRVF